MQKLITALIVLSFVVYIGPLFLVAGCDSPRDPYVPTVCNGCEDMYKPDSYIVNLNFIDHEGKGQVWPYTVTYYGSQDSSDAYRSWPEFVYQTMGTLPTGEKEHWYSWVEPTRRADGMLAVTCVDGAMMVCDFTSIQIQMIKTVSEPLTPSADAVIWKWKKYQAKHDDCPRHAYRNGFLR